MKFYIRNIFRFAALIFFPRWIPQKKYVNNGEKSFQAEVKGRGLPLIISFAGLGDQFNFGNSLNQMNVNVIYLRDLKHNWYLNGLPGIGNSVESLVIYLRSMIHELAPVRIVTIGTSAGGFGAILYGTLLNADSVIAFSPQTFMNKFNCIYHLDYRWLDRVIQIYEGDKSNRKYLDLNQLTLTVDSINIVYDKTHRLDNLHACRIKRANVKHHGVEGGGHALVKELRSTEMYISIIERAIYPGDKA